MTATALEKLVTRIEQEGPPLMVREQPETSAPDFGELVASGPRTSPNGEQYAYVVEAVREGYLCHYGSSRVLDNPDPDLALLAGDLFYAIGIRGLAELEDLESTGILSDLIRVAAELQAAGRSDLAEVLWVGQIVALACGKSDVQVESVAALEAGQEAAAATLSSWSERIAGTNGIGRAFDNVRTAIDSRPSNF